MPEANNAPLLSPQGEPLSVCSNCGRQFRRGIEFCPWCGKRTASRASSCGRIVALVVLGVVALAGGAFGTCTTIFIVVFPYAPGGLAKLWAEFEVVLTTMVGVGACLWQMWRIVRDNRKIP
jgi:hypothetical protein